MIMKRIAEDSEAYATLNYFLLTPVGRSRQAHQLTRNLWKLLSFPSQPFPKAAPSAVGCRLVNGQNTASNNKGQGSPRPRLLP